MKIENPTVFWGHDFICQKNWYGGSGSSDKETDWSEAHLKRKSNFEILLEFFTTR